MFCPKCGSTQSDELKFCKLCGANLFAVRQVVDSREAAETFDWSKTWVAEMFMSPGEMKRRKEELERRRGITPEIKRYNEIKAGVITSFAGIGIAIFLYVFMQGVIQNSSVTQNSVEILSRLWIAGVLPLLVGLSLIVNGLFVSRKLVEIAGRESQQAPKQIEENRNGPSVEPAEGTEFISSGFSVTEDTTKQLRSSGRKQS
jgi:hypothetical protein